MIIFIHISNLQTGHKKPCLLCLRPDVVSRLFSIRGVSNLGAVERMYCFRSEISCAISNSRADQRHDMKHAKYVLSRDGVPYRLFAMDIGTRAARACALRVDEYNGKRAGVQSQRGGDNNPII